MLIVDIPSRKIFTEQKYLQHHKILRSQPLRQEDLDRLEGAVLQPDTPPTADFVTPLKTATQAADGLWYRDYSARNMTAAELVEYKSAKIQQVSDYFNAGVNKQASVYYPQFERDSWPDQRAESEAWLQYVQHGGTEPATPVLDGAVRPGESKTDYANLIISNAATFKSMGGAAIGSLRDVRGAIFGANSKPEIDAIVESVLQ